MDCNYHTWKEFYNVGSLFSFFFPTEDKYYISWSKSFMFSVEYLKWNDASFTTENRVNGSLKDLF